MLLVLDAPQSLPYRVGTPAGALYRKARTALGQAARRVGRRGEQS
jgi:hypothetical protein